LANLEYSLNRTALAQVGVVAARSTYLIEIMKSSPIPGGDPTKAAGMPAGFPAYGARGRVEREPAEQAMKFIHTITLALLMTAATGFGTLAQEAQPTATAVTAKPEKYKDWDLFCPKPQGANAPKVCEIRTIILSDKNKPLGALVVAAEVGSGGKDMIASALLPLGVDLTQQPSLTVGSSKIVLQYLRCLQRGCEAITHLSADQQAALRGGSTAKVAVGIGPGKSATFDFSLAGFSAAHDALMKKIGA
jgi:invasion protein IalB